MYNILDIDGANNTDDDNTVMAPGVERATTPSSDNTGSTYTATNASSITAEVTAAINQSAANQTYILQQMVAMSIAPAPPPPPPGCFSVGVPHPARRQRGNPHRGVSAGR